LWLPLWRLDLSRVVIFEISQIPSSDCQSIVNLLNRTRNQFLLYANVNLLEHTTASLSAIGI
jgi:hypothetical protein